METAIFGDKFTFFSRFTKSQPLLTHEETAFLSNKWRKRKNQAARTALIHHNLRLVFDVALRFKNRGLDLEDLVQEGVFGLMKAVERYDTDKGASFAHYARQGIEKSIRRALANTGRTIRIPVYLCERLGKIMNIIQHLRGALHREPTFDEILSECEFLGIKNPEKTFSIPMAIPLDSALTDDDDNPTTYADILPDTEASCPSFPLRVKEVRDSIVNTIEALKQELTAREPESYAEKVIERDKQIFRRYYALDEAIPTSVREIAERFGISKSNITYICRRIIERFNRQGLAITSELLIMFREYVAELDEILEGFRIRACIT